MAQAKRGKAATPADEREQTRRMVLRRESVIVIPADATVEQVDAAKVQLQGKRSQKIEALPAWIECGEFDGTRKAAIESYAGKAGTPDAKPGEYKAPPASGLRGGRRYVRPDLPLVEAESID